MLPGCAAGLYRRAVPPGCTAGLYRRAVLPGCQDELCCRVVLPGCAGFFIRLVVVLAGGTCCRP